VKLRTEELKKIFGYHLWRQRVQVDDIGWVTPGHLMMPDEWKFLGLPAKSNGFSFLEVGANDGFFPFEAEKRGFFPITALDIYKNEADFISNTTGFPIKGIKLLKEVFKSEVNIVTGSILELHGKVEKHDIVLCNNVLAWVRNLPLAIEELSLIANNKIYIGDEFNIGIRENIIGAGYEKNVLSLTAITEKFGTLGWYVSEKKLYTGFKRYRWKNNNLRTIRSNGQVPVYADPLGSEACSVKQIDNALCQLIVREFCFVRDVGWIKVKDVRFASEDLSWKSKIIVFLKRVYILDWIIWKLKHKKGQERSMVLTFQRG